MDTDIGMYFGIDNPYPTSGNVYFDSPQPNNSQWYHYILTWEYGVGVKIFVNGQLKDSQAFSGTDWTYEGDLYLGGVQQYLSNGHDGWIDEAGLWYYVFNTTQASDYYDLQIQGLNPFNQSSPYFSITSTQVSTFNATINGTDYSTTNGTINTAIDQSNGAIVNITIQADGYFDYNYFNYDTTTDITETQLYQAELKMQAYQILTGLEVDANFTIDGDTKESNETFQLLAGTYNVTFSKQGYYNKTEEIVVSALSNGTQNISNVYDSIINVSAWDRVNEEAINEFDSILEGIGYDINQTGNTSNGSLTFNAIQGVSYRVYVDSFNFAYANETITPNSTLEQVNISVELTNSIKIYIYDVVTGDLINDTNVSISFELGEDTSVNTTESGYFYASNLTPGQYSIDFTATGYDKNTYVVNVTNRSSQTLNAYMSETSSNTAVFTMKDSVTENTISGAVITIQKKIGGSWTIINVLTSDITGRIQFSFESAVEYKFSVVASGYDTKTFNLDPVIFSSYTIWLDQSSVEETNSDYAKINIVYDPNIFYDGQNNTITFSFSSSEGEFQEFGFNATYNGTIISQTGSNAYGETISDTIEIQNASYGDRIIVSYYYELTDGTLKEYVLPFTIQGTGYGEYTFNNNLGETYGLGLLERVLIVVLIALLIGGSAYLFSGMVGAGTMIMLIFGYCTKIGFISGWLTIPSMVILFFATIWGASR